MAPLLCEDVRILELLHERFLQRLYESSMISASEYESFDVIKLGFQACEWEVREQEVKANLSDGSQVRKRQGCTHLSLNLTPFGDHRLASCPFQELRAHLLDLLFLRWVGSVPDVGDKS